VLLTKVSAVINLKRFLVVQNLKIAEVAYSFSRSSSSDTHREKTSEFIHFLETFRLTLIGRTRQNFSPDECQKT